MFAYVGGCQPEEPDRAMVMPGVPRTELSPGTRTSVDAMTRIWAAQNEAATALWLRWYAVVVLFIVATPSRASVGVAQTRFVSGL